MVATAATAHIYIDWLTVIVIIIVGQVEVGMGDATIDIVVVIIAGRHQTGRLVVPIAVSADVVPRQGCVEGLERHMASGQGGGEGDREG